MRVSVRSMLLCGSSLVAAMASVSLAQADMTPATPAPVYTFPQAPNGYFGTNGGAGNDADCTQSSIGEGKPNDGGVGGTPAAYTQTVTSSVSGPTYGTGIIVLSTGGNGGEGGSGSYC